MGHATIRYYSVFMSAQKVPLLDLKAQFAPLRDGVLEAIARVCDAQQFILGPEVEALERELEAFLEFRMPWASRRGPMRCSRR